MPYTIKPMPPAEIPDWHRWMKQIQQGMADTSRFVVDPLPYLLSHMENGGFGLQVVDEDGEKAACLICCPASFVGLIIILSRPALYL